MRRFGAFTFIALLLLVGAVGAVAYDVGLSNGAADAALAEGATVVYAGGGTSPFGLIIGAFFVILLVGLIAKAIAGPRMAMGPGPWGHRRWAGHGHWAQADWAHEDVPEAFRPMLERWHEVAHGEPRGHAASDAPPGAPGGPGPSSAPPPGPRPPR